MTIHFIDDEFGYDGTQLQSLFAYMNYGHLGDSTVAWVGPCDVSFAHMVDGEDVRAQSAIRGSKMLHFIVESFGTQLFTGVALQRLLASIAGDVLRDKIKDQKISATVRRDGDDIFVQDRKFSISIATVSPTSCLIHFAVNVSNEGTPVPTAALEEFKVAPKEFAEELLRRFQVEYSTIKEATMKVRWVK